MTDTALPAAARRAGTAAPALFAGAVFASAALVFLVEPMLGRLILPRLGGSPAVWNTSLAFFQIALLAGYAYAHALQRLVRPVKLQAAVHLAVLAAAGLTLPLRLSGLMGDPPAEGAPSLWLMGLLSLTIGAPFAALSATAPLLQAWFARLSGEDGKARDPYVLYAASNLGSLIALAAYPALVEPMMTLSAQRGAWSVGYLLFVVLAAAVAFVAVRSEGLQAPVVAAPARPTSWRERATWIGLAAVPSSLMLGVTSHISTDVASAPFLWVVPLALYLLTFIIAFQARPIVRPAEALFAQAPVLCACAVILPFSLGAWPVQLGVHLACFFLTALVCHQALAARRPEPARLTEFYLLMSLGGVVGGAFNAFLAPVIFNQVWEYPIALALAGLARPWGPAKFERRDLVMAAVGLVAASAAMQFTRLPPPAAALSFAAIAAILATAFMARDRAPVFTLLIAAALFTGEVNAHWMKTLQVRRSFFGVHHVAEMTVEDGRKVRLLFHGTTVHGARLLTPGDECRPLTYYAPPTPIGQVFTRLAGQDRPLRIGAVGLGAGAVASYTRPGDTLRFFEIDPAVVAIARDSGAFAYVGSCARGQVDYRLGDARLTLAREPAGAFDLLLVDAFSSDSVPTHLLTVEAMRGYLDKLAPGGVALLHLTNRNLDLASPAAAVARAAGASALIQDFQPTPAMGPTPLVTRSRVLAVARRPEDLSALAADPRWRPPPADGARPWSDDYTNVLGALLSHLAH